MIGVRLAGVISLLSALSCSPTSVAEGTPRVSDDPGAEDDGPPTPPVLIEERPATRYIALGNDECLAELDTRGIAYTRVIDRTGLATPVRLVDGDLSGVRFKTLLSDKERARSPYEILDCRLVLALDDWAKQLAPLGIVDVKHFSGYRPPSPGVKPRAHESALAIDVAYFVRADKTSIDVARDFAPAKGDKSCATNATSSDAVMLRRIACSAVDAALFHLVLTPNYDAAHRDHFHLELIPHATTFVAR